MSSLAIATLLLAAGMPQPDASRIDIKAEKVAGNVWILTGQGGNIGITAGDDGVAMVDDQYAGLSPKVHAAIAKISPKPVKFLINTHWHGDHTGGNAQFADTATIFAHENVRSRLAAGGKLFVYDVEPAPKAALPIVTFHDGLSLWWNGEEIKAIHLPPAHTDGDTVVYFTRSNVLHMGDDFITTGFPIVDVGSGGSAPGFVAAIDEIVGQVPADAKVIPGHGVVSTIAELKKWRGQIEEQCEIVRKGLAAGKTVEQLQKEHVLAAWEPTLGQGYVKADAYIAAIAASLQKKK
jgi:cyclase